MATGRPDYTSSTVIHGRAPSGSLVPVAVDASGNLVALIYGSDGTVLRAVKVDTSGQLVMVPRGQSGNYMAVDAAGNLAALLKGAEAGGTLHTLLVDASGQAVMVPRGQSGNYLGVDASGYLTSVMKGLEGATLRTVAVDATGHILGVLQGDYAGALKTLSVDSQGRMQAVLSDPEDVFGNPNYMGAGELAVRLGSIASFERRGQVLAMDDFESALTKWTTITTGAGATVRLWLAAARSGVVSLRALSSATNGQETGVERSIPFNLQSKVGLEVSSVIPPAGCYVVLYLTVYTGAAAIQARLRYLTSTATLQIWTGAGVWTSLTPTVSALTGGINWSTLKLVVDAVTGKYHRVIFNGTQIDASAYSPPSPASGTAPNFYISARVATNESAAVAALFDDAILTQNEPA